MMCAHVRQREQVFVCGCWVARAPHARVGGAQQPLSVPQAPFLLTLQRAHHLNQSVHPTTCLPTAKVKFLLADEDSLDVRRWAEQATNDILRIKWVRLRAAVCG